MPFHNARQQADIIHLLHKFYNIVKVLSQIIH